MAIWLHEPGVYECQCAHCGWMLPAASVAAAIRLMSHHDHECRTLRARMHADLLAREPALSLTA